MSKFMPDTSIEKISPTKARLYLEKNTSNRPLTQRKIDEYAHEMSTGKWVINNDALCFDTNGVLRNGQHRLYAVIKSGETVEMAVTRRMDPESFKYMDTAKTRTAADIIGIEGHTHPTQLASVAKFVINFNRQAFSDATTSGKSRKGMTNADIAAFVDKHAKRLVESIPYGFRKDNRGMVPPGTLAGLYFIFSKKNEQEANDFCDRLITGADLSVDSPIYQLRQKLIANLRANKKMTTVYRLALICKAWNFFVEKKKVANFGWDNMKEPFPKPKAA